MIILVTGGARSGKSHFAEQFASSLSNQGIYIATAQAFDQEMSDRIALHRNQRDNESFQWATWEAPLELTQCLESIRNHTIDSELHENPVILIDCMTLWLSNWFMELDVEHQGTDKLLEVIHTFLQYLQDYPYSVVIVSNEVGNGIVPMNKLSRMYRDEAGRLNQRIAALADKVFLVTASIPIELKSLAYKLEEQ
ncbi:bifunctional adenosylcobinamide kinase/adenosylcobinamide-phosphate guanylyltransferase [Paenibacillus endoradicis]|uniref:bifunctional adenosylcobinamide kinase/adenosylcobinamide-phosphate guanylyltransferase n=1 Tax=Paenibacillus endoradicis TaxID=2972487 RepID=UPI002158BA8D|nr:bifunctional adenosylcobinamide kinase/adenosylcobinamide-phosphate guanylyltransferase [Paenibacillus endoradicis]MCR8656374.1 bifunctional adenosylcobinamide kinase/adenosylcobinamide-phosphate guanylyltransferase [Paenibacillus endoradicis]